jgi:hypothetical protein
MLYPNGEVPYSVVSVVLAKGIDSNGPWEMRCTPAFAARWTYAKHLAEKRYGRTLYIRTGWNIYRPLKVQISARDRACALGNCLAAAFPRYSSHGGNWQKRDCLAVDVDPNGLTWDQVDVVMREAGFSVGLITEAISGVPGGERWHYIDFRAFGPVPTFASFTPPTAFVPIEVLDQKEDDMRLARIGARTASGRRFFLLAAETAEEVTRTEAAALLHAGVPVQQVEHDRVSVIVRGVRRRVAAKAKAADDDVIARLDALAAEIDALDEPIDDADEPTDGDPGIG